jgi:hypothetical protein
MHGRKEGSDVEEFQEKRLTSEIYSVAEWIEMKNSAGLNLELPDAKSRSSRPAQERRLF